MATCHASVSTSQTPPCCGWKPLVSFQSASGSGRIRWHGWPMKSWRTWKPWLRQERATMRKPNFAPLYGPILHPDAPTAGMHFLLELWECHSEGFTFLGTRPAGSKKWQSHPIGKSRRRGIQAVLATHPATDFDIYFCPNAFREPRRRKQFALPTPYAWNDIDDADPCTFRPFPDLLWETSPNRFQGIWRWRAASDGVIAEQYSRNIRSAFGGDVGGWSVTKMLRLPGTINHKSQYRHPVVRLRPCGRSLSCK